MAKRSVKGQPQTNQFDGSAWLDIHNPLAAQFAGTKPETIVVNERTSLSCMAWLTSVRMISETVALLPHCIYKRYKDGTKEKQEQHPWYYLLHDQPNPEMSWFTLIETIVAHVLNNGNGYIQVDWANDDNLLGLYPALPDSMNVERDASGQLVYIYEHSGVRAKIQQPDIIHCKGLGFDGLIGYQPVQQAKRSIEGNIRAEAYQSNFLAKGGQPPGVLKTAQNLNEESKKNLRDNWLLMARNAGIPVLPPGVEWIATAINQEQIQFIESRQLSEKQIYALFRIPQNLIDGTGDQKEAYIQFANRAVLPAVKRLEAEINRKLFPAGEDGTPNEYFCAFTVDGLLRSDIQSRFSAYATGIQWGFLSPARVAQLENWNAPPGGDRYFQPLNMQAYAIDGEVQELKPPAPAQPDPNNPSQANPDQIPSARPREDEERSIVDQFSPAAFDVLRRFTTKEQKNLEDMEDKADFADRAAKFYLRHRENLYLALEPIFVGVAKALGVEPEKRELHDYCNTHCGLSLIKALTKIKKSEEEVIEESNSAVAKFYRSLRKD